MSNAAELMSALGLIAGQGDLPVIIANAVSQSGREVFVVSLIGFGNDALQSYPGATIGLGEIGKLYKQLRSANCTEVTFAGIVKRPDFSKLRLDMKGAALLPKVISAARKGDDALLRVVLDEVEKQGFKVVGSDELCAPLLSEEGLIAGPAPEDSALSDIKKAAAIAASLGNLDIGQGCVVCDGLVLAVEAQEGTDAMLARCAELPEAIRGTENARRGVLLKRPKPSQERRIDLPTIGLSTLKGIAKTGLAGVAIEAHGALILDKEEIETFANRHGIFVYGFKKESVL